MKRLFLLSCFIVSVDLLAGSTPKVVLTLSEDLTKKYVIEGNTPTRFVPSAKLSRLEKTSREYQKQYGDEYEKFKSNLLEKEIINGARKLISDKKKQSLYDRCLTTSIDNASNHLNLESLTSLCAISTDGNPLSINFVTKPDELNNTTFIVVQSNFNGDNIASLFGSNRGNKEPVPQTPNTRKALIKNPCNIDEDPISQYVILPSSAQEYIFLSDKEFKQKKLSQYDEDISYAYLDENHSEDSMMLTKILREDGWPREAKKIELLVVLIVDPTVRQINCAKCPSGWKSNGYNDCLKNGRSLFFSGTVKKGSDDKCTYGQRDQSCSTPCKESCASLRQFLDEVESTLIDNSYFLELTKEEQSKVRRLIAGNLSIAEKRFQIENNLCNSKTKLPLCNVSDYKKGFLFANPNWLERLSSCSGELVPLEVNVHPPVCVKAPCTFRQFHLLLTDDMGLEECPSWIIDSVINEIKQTKRIRDSKYVCETQIISPSEVLEQIRLMNFDCSSYSINQGPASSSGKR